MNLNRLLILPLMPITQHFCYSVKQCSCLDNKHLAASSSEGDAAGGFWLCVCVHETVCESVFLVGQTEKEVIESNMPTRNHKGGSSRGNERQQ